jgi:hypothetical protein
MVFRFGKFSYFWVYGLDFFRGSGGFGLEFLGFVSGIGGISGKGVFEAGN